jgi:hypothetical protein
LVETQGARTAADSVTGPAAALIENQSPAAVATMPEAFAVAVPVAASERTADSGVAEAASEPNC